MNDKRLSWEEAVRWLRAQPDKQELVRQCYYDDPLVIAADRFRNSEEWTAVKIFLKPYIPGKVLDLGAGRGISSYAFAKSGCSVTALEPDPSALVGANAIHSLAEDTHIFITIVQDYGEALPFPNDSFDVVYGRAVLHHSNNLSKLCTEVARVLRPRGVFFATREHVISKKEDLEQFLNSHPLNFLYGGENAFLLSEYKEAIQNGGLKLRKIIGPFESVINYAPMSKKEQHTMITSNLANLVGNIFSGWLVGSRYVRQFYSWYLSQTSNSPGRLYSFLAFKK